VNHTNGNAATLLGRKIMKNGDVAGFYTNLADGPTRVSERSIRQEHPEAIRVEDSRQVRLIPESPQERVQIARTSQDSAQGAYRA